MSGHGSTLSGSTLASRVWKFPVEGSTTTGRAWLDLPEGATPLSVGLQYDAMVVWAFVPNPYAKPHTHRLIVANTGQEIPIFPPETRFLGTVTTENGIVWHVWDGDTP